VGLSNRSYRKGVLVICRDGEEAMGSEPRVQKRTTAVGQDPCLSPNQRRWNFDRNIGTVVHEKGTCLRFRLCCHHKSDLSCYSSI
jgi:hypothetical protein